MTAQTQLDSTRLGAWLVSHRLKTTSGRAILFSLAVVLGMRAWFALWGAFIIQTHGSLIVPDPPFLYWGLPRAPDEGWGLLLAPWQRWDAIWYVRVSQFGYAPDDMSTSFFPLFPIFTRAFAALARDYWVAALSVATAATFGAFVFLYHITADLLDEASARRAVIYWAVFPTSFYFFAPYGESVLALGALAALFFARKKNWALSSIGAAIATLARPVGILIAIPLAIEGWRAGGWRERVRAILPLVAVIAAMGAWMLYLQTQFHDALLWINSEQAWLRIFVLPGQTVVWAIQKIFVEQDSVTNNLVDLTLTLVVFGAVLIGIKKMPLSFSLYAFAMIIVPLLSYSQDVGFAHTPMAAAGRRALIVFPAFIALGTLWQGKWKEPLWLAFSAVTQVILFSIFVQWWWLD